ncbi:MAG: hypothetical protein A3D21_09040 [Nitrospirae bacterium RIFCSPHIGHO2_02_FULL_42_12]|nr:MAG: hypothetical protein A3D21_09040 [Nitrospirae bacterium RIFCSPHIGHO2_02_FULL_42_12]
MAPVAINLKIKKDNPVTETEMRWLNRILSEELGYPVDLKVESVPFISPIVFNRGETLLSDEMKTALLEIRKVYQRSPASKFVIESYPGAAGQKEKRFAEERADIIAALFAEEFKIPHESIKKVVHRGTMKLATLTVSVL